MFRIITYLITLVIVSNKIFCQATYADNATATQMLNALQGDNIILSNPVIISGIGSQFGTFSNGVNGANLLVDSVAILTSGSVTESFSTNSSGGISVNTGVTYSDPDLTAVNPNAIYDPAILEFDFTLLNAADGIKINFQFASDEYPEYVCSQFNDVFGFFVQENGSTIYENIALVPGSGNAVAVNSINNGVGTSGVSGTNNCDETQTALYIDNTGGAIYSEYDGFTVILSAKKLLQNGVTHKMKIAIADAFDGGWDSAVFINFIGGIFDCDGDGIEDDNEIAGQECDACLPNPLAVCDGDCDNDGVLNCDDIEPLNPCVPNATAICGNDCDNDGVTNCIDCNANNASIAYAEGFNCTLTNGANGFIDENCDCTCDVNDAVLDCDNDGILNEIDCDALDENIAYAEGFNCVLANGANGLIDENCICFCDLNEDLSDCDNDGVINLLDCDPSDNQITSVINKCTSTILIFDFGN